MSDPTPRERAGALVRYLSEMEVVIDKGDFARDQIIVAIEAAVAAERARWVAICRNVAARIQPHNTALNTAVTICEQGEAIERGEPR